MKFIIIIGFLLTMVYCEPNYSNVTIKMKWNDIVQYHLNGPPRYVFTRHPDIQTKYLQHKKINSPLMPHIVEKYLQNKKWVIVDNEFPYYMDDGIHHKILWISPQITKNKQQIDKIIRSYTKMYHYDQYIYFENPTETRTIHGITHYHILINNGQAPDKI